MLLFIIVLHILCSVLSNAFPQRNNPNFESGFDFDAYLEHFTEYPLTRTVNDHPRHTSNQDYRYIPLLGERPDYIPPILQRGHFPHPNIPKRVVKHRAWHSTYQNSNFPNVVEQANKNIRPKDAMQNHGRELHRPMTSDFDLPTRNFDVHLHSKIEDFGDFDAPVIAETFERREIPLFRQQSDDFDAPVIVEAVVKTEKPVHHKTHSSKHSNRKKPVVLEPSKKQASISMELTKGKEVTGNIVKIPDIIRPTIYEDYDTPVVAETVIKKEKPITKSQSHKQSIVVDTSDINLSTYTEVYEEPIVVEAFVKNQSPVHNKRHSHKKPNKARPATKKHGHININKPEDNPVSPPFSYPEVYETPIVVEALSDSMVHNKDHGHKTHVKDAHGHKTQVKNAHSHKTQIKDVHAKTDQIVKPEEEMPSTYPEVYETPIVVEALTEELAVHPKEHNHNHKQIEIGPVVIKHDKKDIIADSAKSPVISSNPEIYEGPKLVEPSVFTKEPIVSSYPEVYEAPIVVDSIVEEFSSSKGHGNKKSSSKQTGKKQLGNKSDLKRVEKFTEESFTEEYSYTEPGHLIHEQDDYDIPFVVGSELRHDFEDYDYEDTKPIDHIPKRKDSKEKGHKPTNVQPPKKAVSENTNVNYEGFTSDPTTHQTYDTSKVNEGPVIKDKKRIVKREIKLDYEDYDLPNVVETVVKAMPSEVKSPEYQDYEAPVVVETVVKELPVEVEYKDYEAPVVVETVVKEMPSEVKSSEYQDYEAPVVVERIVKENPVITHKNGHTKPVDLNVPEAHNSEYVYDYDELFGADSIVNEQSKNSANPRIEENPAAYSRNKRDREHYNKDLPKLVNPPARQDSYERPIDKTDVEMHGYEFNVPQRPGDYFDEGKSVPKGNPVHGKFEPLGVPDNQIVLDSIIINRENPDGREIPFLEVLAVEDQVDGLDSGVKVMAFNKENGDVDVINVGHVDSNHEIEDFADQGSGSDVDERSIVPRSFLPLNSNTWSFMSHIQAQERRKFKRCFTPRNETGNCMPVQMCPVPNVGASVDELLKNVCIIDEVFIGICCPEFPVETVRVDWGQFGRPDTEPLIDNLQESKEAKECGKLPSSMSNKDPWPWMAPLVSTASDRVFCGGALVNERYVLTAAHCTSRIPRNQILVRLGSRDSSLQSSEDFAVVEIKRHAQYNPRTMQNDIALLKLSRRVPLGNFRRLVCLSEGDVEDHVGETAVLLRWQGIVEKGASESLPVISNHDCQNRLGTLIGDSVLCTETRNDEAMCNADSGAPLVISKDGKFKIVGVLTWNRNDCDGRIPSVFTRISSYGKWIQNHAI